MASTIHSELPIEDWQIRILTVDPGEFTAPIMSYLRVGVLLHEQKVLLKDSPQPVQYIALSYCWGDDAKPPCGITCNGKRFEIGQNAHNALRSLRYAYAPGPVHLWVDAICINQFDPFEKSQEVPRMITVYAKAMEVAIWLGQGSERVRSVIYDLCHQPDDTLEFMIREFIIANPDKVESLVDSRNVVVQSAESLLCAMQELLGLPWFERIWTKQELWAASKVTLVYEDVDCAWENFNVENFNRVIRSRGGAANTSEVLVEFSNVLSRHERGDPFKLLETQRDDACNEYLSEDHRLDLLNVIRRCHGSKCSQQKDHIYGVMGMSSVNIASIDTDHPSKETFPVSYAQDDAHTFEDFARYLMGREDNLAVLFLEHAFDRQPSGEKVEDCALPSWVPDWTKPYGDLQWLRSRVRTPLSRKRHPRANLRGWKMTTGKPEEFFKRVQHPLVLCGCRLGTFNTYNFSAPNQRYEGVPTSVLDTKALQAGMKLGLLCFDDLSLMAMESFVASNLPLANMLWFTSTSAQIGDIAIAAYGAYAPLLLRPTAGGSDSVRQYSLVGPIILPDGQPALVVENPSPRQVFVRPFGRGITADVVNDHLRQRLDSLQDNEIEDFEVV